MGRRTPDQRRIEDIAACFNTPIVFEPGGWDTDCPAWLRDRVISERVALVEADMWDRATDAEICCYLFTASLNRPIGSDWTDIYLYESALEVPALRDCLEATPKQLTDYQQRELLDLKFKIRNSQLRRKKEVAMSKRKVVLDERENTVIMGIMKENADPVIKTVDGTLETVLAQVPQLITEAEAKWAVSLRNPTYKPEPAAKPPSKPATTTTKPKAAKPGAAEKPGAGDLPLLSDAEKGAAPTAEGAPLSGLPASQSPAADRAAGDAGPLVAAAEEAPKTVVETKDGTDGTFPHPSEVPQQPAAQTAQQPAPPAAAPAPVPAAPPAAAPAAQATPPSAQANAAVTQPGTAPSTTGQWQYKLEDGRGPFNSVQEAMDAMGLDKGTRPQHNRWDRLSTDLKKKIQRVEKVS